MAVDKIRDGQVANRPVYVAMGTNLDGKREVLGMVGGPHTTKVASPFRSSGSGR